MPPLGHGALRDDHDAEAGAPLVALAQPYGDAGEIERHFGDEDGVGAAGHARVQRNPPRVASHDFDDDDAAMGLGGRVQTVDRVGGERHRGVEAEAVGGADDVVVDRLRHADDRDAPGAEPVSDGQRAIAADDDQRVELHLVEHLDDTVRVVARSVGGKNRVGEGVAAVRRPEDSAAQPHDAADVARRERAAAAGFDEAVEAVLEAEALDARVVRRLDDGADDRVEAGCVAAAGEDAELLDRRTGHAAS